MFGFLAIFLTTFLLSSEQLSSIFLTSAIGTGLIQRPRKKFTIRSCISQEMGATDFQA